MGETKQLEEVGYFQDIIGYIFDQKKIVTYKWISNDLGIHVNRAKRLLYTFIKHLTDEKLKELKVTYFIGGILNEDKGHHFQIVSEEELEKVKAQYNVITSEHIYSICLNNCLPDLHSLCSVDGVKSSKAGRNGAICYAKGHPRSEEEISSKRQGVYHAVDGDRKFSSEQLKQPPRNEKKPKDAPSISSMFSAANNKAKSEKEIKEEAEVQKQETSTAPEKKGSSTPKSAVKNTKQPVGRLAALFSAQNSKPKPAKKEIKEDDGEKEKENSKKDVPQVHNGLKAKDKIISVKKDEPEKRPDDVKSETNSQKTQKKKRKRNDHKDRNIKKRKRIVVMNDSDSSSDDPFSSDKEETPPSPDLLSPKEEEEEAINIEEDEEVENREKVTESSHRCRKRRIVDKTFLDEEGYVVTKKVYEFASCSESENEEKENEKSDMKEIKVETQDKPNVETQNKPKVESQKLSKNATKPQKDNKQKKNSPDQKKQATLMNFFKRN